jgi:hypothetical protein
LNKCRGGLVRKSVRSAILTALALCSCATTTQPSTDGCLHPLSEYTGHNNRAGQPIYEEYGWSRGGHAYASLDSALADRPALVAKLHRASGEHTASLALVIGGLIGTIASGAAAALMSTGQQTRESSNYALASTGLFGVAAAVGIGLYLDASERRSSALAQFNRDAEMNGCR